MFIVDVTDILLSFVEVLLRILENRKPSVKTSVTEKRANSFITVLFVREIFCIMKKYFYLEETSLHDFNRVLLSSLSCTCFNLLFLEKCCVACKDVRVFVP